MSTIFSKIIAGEIPSYKIYEDEKFYAFLDIRPMAEGHTLLVPKKEVDYLFDIESDTLSDMIVVAKRIASALEKAISCERIGMMVIGLEVPHAHIHLIPIQKESDMNLSSPRKEFSQDQFKETAKKIQKEIE